MKELKTRAPAAPHTLIIGRRDPEIWVSGYIGRDPDSCDTDFKGIRTSPSWQSLILTGLEAAANHGQPYVLKNTLWPRQPTCTAWKLMSDKAGVKSHGQALPTRKLPELHSPVPDSPPSSLP